MVGMAIAHLGEDAGIVAERLPAPEDRAHGGTHTRRNDGYNTRINCVGRQVLGRWDQIRCWRWTRYAKLFLADGDAAQLEVGSQAKQGRLAPAPRRSIGRMDQYPAHISGAAFDG